MCRDSSVVCLALAVVTERQILPNGSKKLNRLVSVLQGVARTHRQTGIVMSRCFVSTN